MTATFRWIVERRLLTLAGFGVILLGAFIPWPSLAIAATVIVLGAVLLAIQIPIAMRDASEQLDGTDEPDEEWQAPAFPQYPPESYQQPARHSLSVRSEVPEPAPTRPMYETAPAWLPKNIPQSAQPGTSQQAEPSRRLEEPSLPWRPQNIPQYRPEP